MPSHDVTNGEKVFAFSLFISPLRPILHLSPLACLFSLSFIHQYHAFQLTCRVFSLSYFPLCQSRRYFTIFIYMRLRYVQRCSLILKQDYNWIVVVVVVVVVIYSVIAVQSFSLCHSFHASIEPKAIHC